MKLVDNNDVDDSDSGHAFADLVRQLRGSTKQEQFAVAIGVSRPTLANVETGRRPGPRVLDGLKARFPQRAAELEEAYRRSRNESTVGIANRSIETASDEDMFFRRAGISTQLEGTWHALWQTTVESLEVVNAEVLSLKWHGDQLFIENEAPSPDNPKGGYLWRAQARLYDNQYIMGTYIAKDPIVRAKGTLFLLIHTSGTFMLGHWVGCNYDSDWAHGLVAIAREPHRLRDLLVSHIRNYPPLPYWPAPSTITTTTLNQALAASAPGSAAHQDQQEERQSQ